MNRPTAITSPKLLLSIILAAFAVLSFAEPLARAPENLLAVGQSFVAYLDRDGHVWTWGEDDNGSLGLPDFSHATSIDVKRHSPGHSDVIKPMKLALEDIVSVKSGGWNAYALGSDGTLWGWGNANDLGLPGNLAVNEKIWKPTKIPNLPPIQKLYTRSGLTLALDNEQRLWMWGPTTLCNPLSPGWGGQIATPRGFSAKGLEPILPQELSFLIIRSPDGSQSSCARPPFPFLDGTRQFGPMVGQQLFVQLMNGEWHRIGPRYEERLDGLGPIRQIVASNGLLIMLQEDGNLRLWNDTDSKVFFTAKLTVPGRQTRIYQPPEPLIWIDASNSIGVFALGQSGSVYAHVSRASAVTRYRGPKKGNVPEFVQVFDTKEVGVTTSAKTPALVAGTPAIMEDASQSELQPKLRPELTTIETPTIPRIVIPHGMKGRPALLPLPVNSKKPVEDAMISAAATLVN